MNTINEKTRITATAIGTLLGISGILNHGIFEILQGNTPTNGLFIEAIGPAHQYWLYGTEGAFTLIPNFLATGIIASLVGLAIVAWSVKYLHRKHGSTVLIFLFILLTLVGGGLGYLVLVLPVWAFSTRINKSLDRWGNVLPGKWIRLLPSLWIYILSATLISWLIVMQLGIFGYVPGQDDPDTIMNIVFMFLFATVVLACITFICAIAADLKKEVLQVRSRPL